METSTLHDDSAFSVYEFPPPMVFIPYCFVAIPLTVLSAVLLFGKRRINPLALA